MTQKEMIDKVHGEMSGRVTFTEMVHRLADTIGQEGETSLKAILSRLEPASCAYVHTYPDDISDGPWDV